MDPVDPVALARQLIDIDSTTGREGEVARVLASYLRERGYSVLEQPLRPEGQSGGKESTEGQGFSPGQAGPEGQEGTDGLSPLQGSPGLSAVEGGPGHSRSHTSNRINVIAAVGEPQLVFSTHFDCVPPFFPSRLEGELLYGRGSCDAKGILAAQIAAAERLRAAGEHRIGLVFVAGEERGSDGAMAANRIASQSRFLINGEPTDNRLAAATRGVYRVRLTADGRAAHSGYPELGESAIDKLLDVLAVLRSAPLPSDDVLGPTHYTVGVISGGVAPNVVPPHAEAEIIFRSVGDHDVLRDVLRGAARDRVRIEEVLEVPPVRLRTEDGFETAVFAFTTDIPFLDKWGTALLLGPGSIHVAHTDREHVKIPELRNAVDLYESLALRLLRS